MKVLPGQHNMIFVLERCSDAQKRAENRIKVAKVKKEFGDGTVKERLKKLLAHLEEHIEEENYSDEYIDVFTSSVRQGDLTEKTWNLVQVGEVGKILEKIEQKGTPLIQMCNVNQGIVSGADKVTERNIKLLPEHLIATYDIKVGDGIFVLSREELQSLQLSEKETSLIKPFYKNSDIDRYHINLEKPREFIILSNFIKDLEEYSNLKTHLEKFQPILTKRSQMEHCLDWWDLHQIRMKDKGKTGRPKKLIFEGEKIVISRRAQYNIFAIGNQKCFEQSDITIIIVKEDPKEAIKYILALLNSIVLDFWFEHKGKPKGGAREYYFTPLSVIPIRRINFDDHKEVKIHDHLVELVDNIIETKKNLASYNRFFPRARLTRLQENEPLPEISDEEVVRSLESSVLRTIRTYPQIRYQPQTIEHFFLKGAKLAEDAQSLLVVSKDKQVLTITAPQGVLEYLQKVLPNYRGTGWSEIIDQVLVPTEPGLIDKKRAEILSKVSSLRDKIKSLQQEIDSIVFDLYGLSKEERKVII